MSGFKLLAIRPLEGCEPEFLKNLKEGMIYKFYQNFDYFILDKNEKVKLTISNYDSFKGKSIAEVVSRSIDQNLYSTDDLKINISAVVGKNGSGKSALTEIFLKAMFDLSIENKWIRKEKLDQQFHADREFIENQILILQQSIAKEAASKIADNDLLVDFGIQHANYSNRLVNHKNFVRQLDDLLPSKLYFEIIFQDENGETFIIRKQNDDQEISIEGIQKVGNFYAFKQLFYSIFLNYSIYGLNASEIGRWIDFLYHKNDGYETPVVINPQKTDGNIDVNREEELSRYRVNRVAITRSKILDLNISKIKFLKKEKTHNFEFEYHWDNDELRINHLVDKPTYNFKLSDRSEVEFLNRIFDFELDDKKLNSELISLVVKYFLGKLFKSDNSYNLGAFIYDSKNSVYKLSNLTKYFHDNILKNSSHKTLKLRQLKDLLVNKFDILLSIQSALQDQQEWGDFTTFRNLLNIGEAEDMLISFTSIFDVDYQLEDGSEYFKFSSGQKQFINTIETINYHIRNVVSNSDYKWINIILDEVELYFHPEYQRQLIQTMIDSIHALKLSSGYSINILFLTHSPFILSDIPSSNILRLKDGEPQSSMKQTFASNIYDLLKDDFFLENGVIGEFAKEKIRAILEQAKITENDLKIIDLIGDPLLKGIINEKANQKLKNAQLIRRQIENLEKQLIKEDESNK